LSAIYFPVKQKSLITFFLISTGIILLNLLLNTFPFQADLTEDQRYTLSPATLQLLEKAKDEISVIVYLDGELPAGFKRLQTALKEKLQAFAQHSEAKITFHFIDPTAISDKKAREKFYTELAQKGIQPTNLFAREDNKKVERLIFPGAVLSRSGKEVTVSLLKGTRSAAPQQILNQSVENVEFELADAIRRLGVGTKKRLGILAGHGEPANIQLADLITQLQPYYEVFRVPISQTEDTSLAHLDGLLIIKPDTAYSEEDKFKIDQFIVKGGVALFFLDALKTGEISENGTLASPVTLNLEDLLFRYGVRLNADLLKDLTSARIPMVTGKMGNQNQTQMMPYRYFPLLNTFANHPITRNLDVLYLRYTGTLDTVKVAGIVKTPLLMSSPYTKILQAPVMVAYDDARRDPDPKTFQAGNRTVAYLLEGKFRSLYAHRVLNTEARFKTFREYGKPSRVLVCADGDLPVNAVSPQGQPMPLGYDPFSRQLFGNKDFVLHAVDFLLAPQGLILARNKEVTLRPLDKVKVREGKTYWQVLNLGLPLGLLGIFGLGWNMWRRKRWKS
jgi:ABC-2 type transport system permease protein